MKKYLLLALLFVAGFSAFAAQRKIVNNTQCLLVVKPVCYDPLTCISSGGCGPTITVPPGGSVLMPICNCSPRRQGFVVCYAPSTGCNACANVGDPAAPCTAFPVPGVLAPCDRCTTMPITLTYNSAGDLIMQ